MFDFVTKVGISVNHLSNVCKWPNADQFQISCDKNTECVQN